MIYCCNNIDSQAIYTASYHLVQTVNTKIRYYSIHVYDPAEKNVDALVCGESSISIPVTSFALTIWCCMSSSLSPAFPFATYMSADSVIFYISCFSCDACVEGADTLTSFKPLVLEPSGNTTLQLLWSQLKLVEILHNVFRRHECNRNQRRTLR